MFEKVDIGTSEDTGDGDSLRAAFEKLNRNFESVATVLASVSAELADIRAEIAPDWPGRSASLYVTDIPPNAAPSMIGAIWIDSMSGVAYVSVGTMTTEDWVLIASAES